MQASNPTLAHCWNGHKHALGWKASETFSWLHIRRFLALRQGWVCNLHRSSHQSAHLWGPHLIQFGQAKQFSCHQLSKIERVQGVLVRSRCEARVWNRTLLAFDGRVSKIWHGISSFPLFVTRLHGWLEPYEVWPLIGCCAKRWVPGCWRCLLQDEQGDGVIACSFLSISKHAKKWRNGNKHEELF